MKITLDTNSAVIALRQDTNASWSRNGARALVEHLESLEEETGAEIEFDAVALRCDWSEYPTALDAAGEYGWIDGNENYTEKKALDWLMEQTQVIQFDGGVIVQNF